jgi:hypothetical protein
MQPNGRQSKIFMLTLEGIGAVFVAVFLAAYLGGMFMTPSTTVLHMEPAFRIPLIVLGIVLMVLILAGAVLSATHKIPQKPVG